MVSSQWPDRTTPGEEEASHRSPVDKSNGSPKSSDDFDRVEDLLRSGQIVDCRPIPWSSNYTFTVLVRCDHSDAAVLKAVYKPKQGEAPLYDFPSGTLYLREMATYLTSRALGWLVVPPTVVRDGPFGTGSVQLYIPHDPNWDYFQRWQEHLHQVQRLAVFDYLVNNADRKAGHILLGPGGQLWGIDHGLTFHTQPKLRTVIWHFQGEPIPETLLQEVASLASDQARVDALAEVLARYLARSEVEAFFRRLSRLLEQPQFPLPSARRSYPWPLY